MHLTEQWKIVKHNLAGQHLEKTQVHVGEVKQLRTEQVKFDQDLAQKIIVRKEKFVTPGQHQYNINE